jgi:hypothetical protein
MHRRLTARAVLALARVDGNPPTDIEYRELEPTLTRPYTDRWDLDRARTDRARAKRERS